MNCKPLSFDFEARVNSGPPAHFDGETYDPAEDFARLTGQLLRVFGAMRDGEWRTFAEIKALTGDASDASISARLRDLRKPKFGGHEVQRRRVSGGLYSYRLIVRAR